MISHSHATGDNNNPNYNEHIDFVDSCRDIEMNSEIEADVQGIMYLEHDLHNLRSQRLEELHQRIYIAPMAKPSLQAQDDDLFPLMEKGQEFLASEREVMLILGDSGAGKSTFNRHLEYQLWTDYEQGGPIPLYVNLPLIDNPAQSLIEKLLELHNFSQVQIQEMKLHRQFVLICDGYDESQLKVNIHTTNKFNQPGQWRVKVVISCRTQYLGQDYRSCFQPQPVDRHHAARSDLFQEAVIAPFSKHQIEEYVARYVPLECRPWVAEDYMRILTTIPSLMDLVKNPFLLMLSLEVLPAITEDKQDLTTVKVTRVQLYDIFVVHWLEVNQRRLESNALSMDDRNVFDQLLDAGFTSMGIDYSTRLALAIFDRQDGRPVVQYKDLHDSDSWKEEFFGPEPVTRLLQEASPLTRSGDQFWFIHRTMLEYFFSRVIYSPVTMDNEFDPQAKNESFAAHAIGLDNPLFGYNLVAESSIIQFLCDRVKLDAAFEQQLCSLIDQSKTDESATIAATNAITILVRAGVCFHGVDLRGVKIPGSDLSDGQFDSTQFQGADLRRVNLSRCWLRQADMSSARMEGVQFGELPYLEMDANVYSCAYSPDGGILALGLGKGRDSMGMYDTSSWTETFRLGGAPAVLDVAFSPNGQVIVSGEETGMLRLRDCCSGQAISVLEGHNVIVRSVAFSPCGKQIASASHDKTVRLWDMQTGEIRFVLEGHTNFVTSVKYSPKGEQLVSGGWDETVRFWDPVTGEPRVVLRSSYAFVHCLAYSPDGQWVVSGHPLGELQLWNTVTYEPGPILQGHTSLVHDVAFSPNGQWLASASNDISVRLWDASTCTLVSIFSGHSSSVECVAFSPDSLQIATGGCDKKVRLWKTNLSSSSFETPCHTGPMWGTIYCPDGRSIISLSDRHSIRKWNSLTGEFESLSFSFDFPERIAVQSFVLSPDGIHIAACLWDNSLQLWNLHTGAAQCISEARSVTTLSMAFSPCGRWIVSSDNDMNVRLWDLVNTLQHPVLFCTKAQVSRVTVSPDGCQIALLSTCHTIDLLDRPSGELLSSTTLEADNIQALVFSPVSQQLAIGTNHGSVKLWNLHSDKPGVGLKGHVGGVDSIAYSPCGQWIASGSGDMSVRLWRRQQQANEAENWLCSSTIRGFIGSIHDIAWNPVVEMEFVTTCMDGSIRVWRVSSCDGGVVVKLHWGSRLGILCAADMILKSVIDLGPVNKKLLTQRGAISLLVNEHDD